MSLAPAEGPAQAIADHPILAMLPPILAILPLPPLGKGGSACLQILTEFWIASWRSQISGENHP